jgi:chromosomal replication initiation ATPase DnaA
MVFRCLRVEYKKTFTSIAEHFDMDHTTVIHSINKLEDLMSVYPDLREDYINYISNLKNLLD